MQGGSITVSGTALINGDLNMKEGTSLKADGADAGITVTGAVSLGGGEILAVNGARVTLPGMTRYSGGGRLRAVGTGSILDLKNLTSIGLNLSEPVDNLIEAISREYTAYQLSAGQTDPPETVIKEAVSREYTGYHLSTGLTESPEKALKEAVSREYTGYHLAAGLTDPEETVIKEAISREVSLQIGDVVQ